MGNRAQASTVRPVRSPTAARRPRKSARSRSSRNSARRSSPRTITWWSVPGASQRGPRGIGAPYPRGVIASRTNITSTLRPLSRVPFHPKMIGGMLKAMNGEGEPAGNRQGAK